MYQRLDGRAANKLRKIEIIPSVNPHAEGSVEVSFGSTKLLVTASVEEETPRWMKEGDGGWITAEYGMLPRSTHSRMKREASAQKQGGRTLEIQRLIGRSLRAAADLKKLEGISIKIDCDVLIADGGTRTAAISGAWVALSQAIDWCKEKGKVSSNFELLPITAISVGVVKDTPLLDLCYIEDSSAEFDMNVVLNAANEIVEIQGTAEEKALSFEKYVELFDLARAGIEEIRELQKSLV